MTGSGGTGERVLMAGAFSPGQLAAIRGRISRFAAGAGLNDEGREDFVTAVNEALTNVVRHGGGTGTLRLWHDHDLVCEVCDTGPGFDARIYAGRTTRPAASGSGGLGLWLVRRLSPRSEIHSGPGGTRVRIVAPLPG
jgi:anti-sigma regulatory factor (Ser/Thr protein kinase)